MENLLGTDFIKVEIVANVPSRSNSSIKGKVILDKPMTAEEYKAAEQQYLIEREEALKDK